MTVAQPCFHLRRLTSPRNGMLRLSFWENDMKARHVLGAVLLAGLAILLTTPSVATVFGNVRGIVHDPQHRPIQGAEVTLKAQTSDWTASQTSNASGEVSFQSVPIGTYTVTVKSTGFLETQQDVIVQSDTSPVLHFKLAVAGSSESVVVSGTPVEAPMDTVTPTTMLNRQDIQKTPGADRTNSVEMITDYVPGNLCAHDMLHMSGRTPGPVADRWGRDSQHQHCH